MGYSSGQEGAFVQASVTKLKPLTLLDIALANTRQKKRDQAHLIQLAHGSTGRRDGVIDEEEQSIFRPQVDPLSDQEVELTN